MDKKIREQVENLICFFCCDKAEARDCLYSESCWDLKNFTTEETGDKILKIIKDLGYVKKSELVIDETATLELFGKYSDLVLRAKQYLSYRISEASQDLIKEKETSADKT